MVLSQMSLNNCNESVENAKNEEKTETDPPDKFLVDESHVTSSSIYICYFKIEIRFIGHREKVMIMNLWYA